MPNERRYLVYDGRASGGNTDDAAVLLVEDSLEAATRETRKCFGEGAIYSYAADAKGDLTDERFERNVLQDEFSVRSRVLSRERKPGTGAQGGQS